MLRSLGRVVCRRVGKAVAPFAEKAKKEWGLLMEEVRAEEARMEEEARERARRKTMEEALVQAILARRAAPSKEEWEKRQDLVREILQAMWDEGWATDLPLDIIGEI